MKLSESNEPYKFVSHRARMSEEFDARKDSHSTKLEQRPQILIKLGFRELYDLKSYLVEVFLKIWLSHGVKNRPKPER